jgi:uncharacterized protein YraI
MRKISLMVLALLVVSVVPALAQDECALLFQEAVDATRQACADTGTNQVCYGYAPATPDPRPEVRLVWAEPGDIVDAAALAGFSTGGFDLAAGEWGIALANVRASLPEGVVTLLAFGHARIENASDAPSDFAAIPVTASAASGVNIRTEPVETAARVAILQTGDVVKAAGRTADNSWLWVMADDESGWVAASLMRAGFDVSVLPVRSPEQTDSYVYGPLQAFNFETTAQAERPCANMPDSGILLQTPDTEQEATFIANTLEIVMSGTAWLQTPAPAEVQVSVLEGAAQVNGQVVQAGSRAHFVYRGQGFELSALEEYAFVRARYLPLPLLPREFALPFALGDVIFPFEPGSGFLTSILADADCVAAWAGDVNMRSGPGTDYPLRRGVPGGYYAYPDGRATNGGVWWRLADGIWIAANVTVTAGACGNLPQVEPPPLSN